MSAGGRLTYRVVSCSSEDPEFPASELVSTNAGPGTSTSSSRGGWQSARFCTYPQEIVFDFGQAVSLKQIQFLSHQSKIASKIELYVGVPDGEFRPSSVPQLGDVKFKRLGYLSLDTNERSNFSARELKTVFVDVNQAYYLKILLKSPHPNRVNNGNQVGLVGVFCTGRVLNSSPINSLVDLQTEISPHRKPNSPQPTYSSTLANAGFPAGVGSVNSPPHKRHFQNNINDIDHIAPYVSRAGQPSNLNPSMSGQSSGSASERALADLERRKYLAAQAEDYEEAKRIKAEIERLHAVSRAVGDLEMRKKKAVADEDFDLAKALKQEIDKLSSNPTTQDNRVAEKFHAFTDPNNNFPSHQSSHHSSARSPDFQSPARQEISRDISKFANNLDEVPAVARGDALKEFASFSQNRPSNNQPSDPSIHPLDGCNIIGYKDLPAPVALTAAELAVSENEPLAELVGEYVVACVLSKDWKLREAGIAKLVHVATESKDNLILPKLLPVVKRAADDKNPQVFSAAQALTVVLAEKFLVNLRRSEAIAAVDFLVEKLAEKAGDSNRRVHDGVAASLLAIARSIGPSFPTQAVIRSLKNRANKLPAKTIVGRAWLLARLCETNPNQLGISRSATPEEPFAWDSIVAVAAELLQQGAGEVRAAGVEVLKGVKIGYAPGNRKPFTELIEPALANLRIQQRELVEIELSGVNTKMDVAPHTLNHFRDPNSIPDKKPGNSNSKSYSHSSTNHHGQTLGSTTPRSSGRLGHNPQTSSSGSCPFCGMHDAAFTLDPNALDIHYLRTCPALMECEYCGQIVEKNGYQEDHLDSGECQPA